MIQVTEHVWTITTLRGCNPSVIQTREGTVIVDTPQLPTRAVAFRDFAESVGAIRFIVNTEHHVDHIFGNYFFHGAGEVVQHRGVLDNYMECTPALDSFSYALEAVEADDPDGLALLPDRATYLSAPNSASIVFNGDLTLRVGNTDVRLLHTPGHTPGQIAVHVPSEGVLFTGDTVFARCQTWLMNSSVTQWLAAIDRVEELEFEHIVPGHGPVVDRSALADQRDVLHEWVSSVADAVKLGWTRDEAVERISFADRCPVDVGQEHMMEFVQRHNVESLWNKLTAGSPP